MVSLLDTESLAFYIKQCDSNGDMWIILVYSVFISRWKNWFWVFLASSLRGFCSWFEWNLLLNWIDLSLGREWWEKGASLQASAPRLVWSLPELVILISLWWLKAIEVSCVAYLKSAGIESSSPHIQWAGRHLSSLSLWTWLYCKLGLILLACPRGIRWVEAWKH